MKLAVFLIVTQPIFSLFYKKERIMKVETGEVIDGRVLSEDTIDWKEIKAGDVVIEGKLKRIKDIDSWYRTLTQVDGKYWEYFDNGYYHATSPENCEWLVSGQKMCDGSKLIKIVYNG